MSETNEYRPSKLQGLLALTNRELKKWVKEPMILAMAIFQPILWMGLFGKSMSGMFAANSLSSIQIPDHIPIPGTYIIPQVNGVVYVSGAWLSQVLQQMFSEIGTKALQNIFGVADYFSYMAMGMVSMIVMFTTMFSGMSIVWDRRLGFLDKVLSTPVSRAAIILSKVFNAALRAMFQATIIIALAVVFGLQVSPTFTPINVLGVYAAIFLLSTGLSSLFLALALRSTKQETQMAIVNLINMPLTFTSNAFVPISTMPELLQPIARINPVTYLTDAIRQLMVLPLDLTALLIDFAYLGVFAVVFSSIGIMLSWRYLTK
ncbi:MAG: ABC transporter permease [Candidatus Bathyarchaeota archaeon]|nr:ABC transporter permease [Candidatus Bathyarchaeota archaeon]